MTPADALRASLNPAWRTGGIMTLLNRGTMVRWLSSRWSNPVESYVHPPGAPCPECASAAGRVTLLTPWTAYYSCSECHREWSDRRA